MKPIEQLLFDSWVFFLLLFRKSVIIPLLLLIIGFITVICFNYKSNFSQLDSVIAEEDSLISEESNYFYFLYLNRYSICGLKKDLQLIGKEGIDFVLMTNSFINGREALMLDMRPDSLRLLRSEIYRDANSKLISLFGMENELIDSTVSTSEYNSFFNPDDDFETSFESNTPDTVFLIPNKIYLFKNEFIELNDFMYRMISEAIEKPGSRRSPETVDLLDTLRKGYFQTKCIDVPLHLDFGDLKAIVSRNLIELRNRFRYVKNRTYKKVYYDSIGIWAPKFYLDDHRIFYNKNYLNNFPFEIVQSDSITLDTSLAALNIQSCYLPVYIRNPFKKMKGCWLPRIDGNYGSVFGFDYYGLQNSIMQMEQIRKKHGLYTPMKIRRLQAKLLSIKEAKDRLIFNYLFLDLIVSMIFAFFIAFFAYIYLKREIAFILIHKNKFRMIEWIFRIWPIILLLLLKVLFLLNFKDIWEVVCWPSVISFILFLAGYLVLLRYVAFKGFLDKRQINLFGFFRGL